MLSQHKHNSHNRHNVYTNVIKHHPAVNILYDRWIFISFISLLILSAIYPQQLIAQQINVDGKSDTVKVRGYANRAHYTTNTRARIVRRADFTDNNSNNPTTTISPKPEPISLVSLPTQIFTCRPYAFYQQIPLIIGSSVLAYTSESNTVIANTDNKLITDWQPQHTTPDTYAIKYQKSLQNSGYPHRTYDRSLYTYTDPSRARIVTKSSLENQSQYRYNNNYSSAWNIPPAFYNRYYVDYPCDNYNYNYYNGPRFSTGFYSTTYRYSGNCYNRHYNNNFSYRSSRIIHNRYSRGNYFNNKCNSNFMSYHCGSGLSIYISF